MRSLGFPTKKAQVLELFRLYERDVESDGLEFFEFREIMMDKILAREPAEEYRNAFHLFDKDGSGKISLRDMRLVRACARVCVRAGRQAGPRPHSHSLSLSLPFLPCAGATRLATNGCRSSFA